MSATGPNWYTGSPLCVPISAPGITRKNINSISRTLRPITAAVPVATVSSVRAGSTRSPRTPRATTSANSTTPTIISRYRSRYRNGNRRGFQSSPMTGKLSRVMYTPATSASEQIPNHAPFRCRRAMDATKPMIANVVMNTSKNVVSGKNMSQKESLAPDGRKPYFMSVIEAWSNRNGTTQNAANRNVVMPVVMP